MITPKPRVDSIEPPPQTVWSKFEMFMRDRGWMKVERCEEQKRRACLAVTVVAELDRLRSAQQEATQSLYEEEHRLRISEKAQWLESRHQEKNRVEVDALMLCELVIERVRDDAELAGVAKLLKAQVLAIDQRTP